MLLMRRFLASTLTVCLIGVGFPANSHAALIATDTAAGNARERIADVLQRSDVREQLRNLGVKPADVSARVAALSDAEAAQLAGQLDELPAGGDGLGALIGALLIVFLVLLITDILGLTKVFPFTKPIK